MFSLSSSGRLRIVNVLHLTKNMFRTRMFSNHNIVNMEVEVVTLLKVPVKVMCFGGVTPSRLVKNPSVRPKELVLIIPGNPGLVEFYPLFGARICEKTKLPVWVVSHGGHEDLPSPPLSAHPDLYNLQGQVRQKQELIDSYLKGVQIKCIGHSIGAKIILDLMKSGEQYADQLDSGYFLFPTVERMAETPNGKKVCFGIQYLYWMIFPLLNLLNSLPTLFKKLLLRLYFICDGIPLHNSNAFMKLLESRVIRKVIYLADDEMKSVTTRDDDVIEKYQKRLRFYYSAIDGWTPLDYYEDLKKKFPDLKAEVDNNGIEHSFVLSFSVQVGDIVSNWINSDKK